jgi:capsular polysaccharide transport system permease protein
LLKKRGHLEVFTSVIYALFLREVNVRFSAGTLGYFWVIFEPLIQISIFVAVKLALFGSKSNFDYAIFITVGFIAFNLFRHIVDRSMSAFKSNKGLYAYKQVKPIDGLIARVLVEILISAVISLIFIAVAIYMERGIEVENLGLVLSGFLWLIVFAFGVGLFVAVVGVFVNSFLKVVKLILSPMMFISAVFYPMQNLPQTLQDILYFNPLAHFIEMIHSAIFIEIDDSFIDYNYILLWTLTPLYLGLFFYRKLEKRIISA